MKCILVLVLNILDFHKINLYELELMACIKAWRKNSGYLSAINIFCYTTTIDKISLATQNFLKKFNVKLINLSVKNNFLSIWRFVYLLEAQKFAIINNIDYIINIDLDVYIKKPLPKFIFNDRKITVCIYNTIIKKEFYQSSGFRNTNEIDNKKRFLFNIKNNYDTVEELLTIHNVKSNIIFQLDKISKSLDYIEYYNKNIYNPINLYYKHFYYSEALYDYVLNVIMHRNDVNCLNLSLLLNNFLIHKHIKTINDLIQINLYVK